MRSALIGLLLTCGATAIAASPPAVLLQPERPTVAQINQLYPIGSTPKVSATAQASMINKIPGLIASFEFAFPGATYYELGRDAVYLGDILDAFYTSIGQPGRVQRIDASNTSFKSDDVVTNEFLKGTGIDVLKLENGYPAVIFDVTSFNHVHGVGSGASQSVQVIRSGYRAYVKAGRDPKNLVSHYNFISVGGMARRPDLDIQSDTFDRESLLNMQRASASEKGFDKPFYADGAGYTYRFEEWHPMFGPFEVQADGVTRASLPHVVVGDRVLQERSRILAATIEARDIVTTPEFLRAVQQEALAMGFEFSVKRTMTPNTMAPEVVAQMKAKIVEERREAARKQAMNILSDRKRDRARHLKLSALAEEYFEQVDIKVMVDGSSPLRAVDFILEDLLQSSSLDRWSDNDLKGFLKLFYSSHFAMESEGLMRDIAKISAKHPRLAHLVLENTFKTDPTGSDSLEYRIGINQTLAKELVAKIDLTQVPPSKPKKAKRACKAILGNLF